MIYHASQPNSTSVSLFVFLFGTLTRDAAWCMFVHSAQPRIRIPVFMSHVTIFAVTQGSLCRISLWAC